MPLTFWTSSPARVGFRTAEKEGLLHRADGPAVVWADGSEEFYLEGLRHRGYDQPAVIYADGILAWCRNGRRHRDRGPAEIWRDGSRRWYREGLLHRTDGPALIDADGAYQWYLNGNLHRRTGDYPASRRFEDGAVWLEWVKDGELHRRASKGPALIVRWPDGSGRDEYWCRGELYEFQGASAIRRYSNGRIVKHYSLCDEVVTQRAWREQMTEQWGNRDLITDLVPGDFWNAYLLDEAERSPST